MFTVNGKKRTDIVAVLKSKSITKSIKCTLSNISIQNETFNDINLLDSNINTMEFNNCTIRNLKITNTDINIIGLFNCKIGSITFINCDIGKISMVSCIIENSYITKSNIDHLYNCENQHNSYYYIQNSLIKRMELLKSKIDDTIHMMNVIISDVTINKNEINIFKMDTFYSNTIYLATENNINIMNISYCKINNGMFRSNNIKIRLEIRNNSIYNFIFTENLLPNKHSNTGNLYYLCGFTNFYIDCCENTVIKCSNAKDNLSQIFKSMSILPEGDIIGWKKCKDDKIVKLLIPAHAERSNFHRKCRASEAKVLGFYAYNHDNMELTELNDETHYAVSIYDNNFKYIKNYTVKPYYPFSKAECIECASGIHFFITKEEAIKFST